MSRLRELFLRFGGLFNKQRKDRDLDDEIESHLQMHIEDNLRAGMSPEEARRQAMIRLGGIESTKEAYRDQRGLPMLETFTIVPMESARSLSNRAFRNLAPPGAGKRSGRSGAHRAARLVRKNPGGTGNTGGGLSFRGAPTLT